MSRTGRSSHHRKAAIPPPVRRRIRNKFRMVRQNREGRGLFSEDVREGEGAEGFMASVTSILSFGRLQRKENPLRGRG